MPGSAPRSSDALRAPANQASCVHRGRVPPMSIRPAGAGRVRRNAIVPPLRARATYPVSVMQYRRLGKTGYEISAIGFGAWAIGADWGDRRRRATPWPPSMPPPMPASTSSTPPTSTATATASELIARFLKERAASASTWPPRWAGAWSRSWRTTRPRPSWPGPSARATTSTPRRWTWSSCTARPSTSTTRPSSSRPATSWSTEGVMRHYGVSVEKVEQAAEGHGVPGRGHRPDHLQHGSPASGRPLPGRGPGQ